MAESSASRGKLPKGVSALPRARGGRGYKASIRRGKGVEVHLGLYETPWLAAFAFGVAAQALGRNAHPLETPTAEQPDAEQVRLITARVHRRLGLDRESSASRKRRSALESPPATEDLLTLFAVTVVGFWRVQSGEDSGDHPEAGLDAAAGRLVEAAGLLFWSRAAGHPSPLDAMTELLARRLDHAFRRADLTRAVLDDDGDDPFRVARWLAHPDEFPGRRLRGFRAEVAHLYAETVSHPDSDLDDDEPTPAGRPSWAVTLGVEPPFTSESVRAAYLAQSRASHPDAGGTAAAFVRLRDAYDAARAYCATRSV